MSIATVSNDLEPATPQAKGIIAKLRGDDYTREQISLALPPTVTLDRFTRATVTALMQTPSLSTADQVSLFQSIVKCAQDGLLPDGREAALVVYRTKVKDGDSETWVEKVQYLPMIAGIRKLVAEYGWTIKTHVVYDGDSFDVDLGTERITHRPAAFGTARGEVVGAYAIAFHRDGRQSITEVMDKAELEKHRAVSKAKDSGPWKQWYPQMCEKTVGHRIAKKLPLDPSDADRLSRVIDATDLDAGEATELLYGPEPGASFSELPSGVLPQAQTEGVDRPSTDGVDTPEGGSDPDPAAAAPTIPVDEEARMLADEAADYVPPTGVYSATGEKGPMTLREIHALPDGEGEKWLQMLLRRLDAGEWRTQVEAYCAVYLPERAEGS